MNKILVSHAALLSEDKTKCYVEKNQRYDWKLTFFWWKLNKDEDFLSWIKRELKEETWIDFSDNEIKILISEDKLIIWENTYIWRVYAIFLTKTQIEKLLNYNNRNIEIDTNDSNLNQANFAFGDLISKIKLAISKF